MSYAFWTPNINNNWTPKVTETFQNDCPKPSQNEQNTLILANKYLPMDTYIFIICLPHQATVLVLVFHPRCINKNVYNLTSHFHQQIRQVTKMATMWPFAGTQNPSKADNDIASDPKHPVAHPRGAPDRRKGIQDTKMIPQGSLKEDFGSVKVASSTNQWIMEGPIHKIFTESTTWRVDSSTHPCINEYKQSELKQHDAPINDSMDQEIYESMKWCSQNEQINNSVNPGAVVGLSAGLLDMYAFLCKGKNSHIDRHGSIGISNDLYACWGVGIQIYVFISVCNLFLSAFARLLSFDVCYNIWS